MHLIIFISVIVAVFAANSNGITTQHNADKIFNGRSVNLATMSADGKTIIPDLRKSALPFTAEIISDPIDLCDTSATPISEAATVKSIELSLDAGKAKLGKSVKLFISFSDNPFSDFSWSSWTEIKKTKIKKSSVNGRYLKYKILLLATTKSELPSISSVTISAQIVPNKFVKPLIAKESLIQEAIWGSIPFQFEQPFYKPYVELFKEMGYDTVWNKYDDELSRIIALNTAVARTPNPDHSGWDGPYPFDARELCKKTDSTMVIKGHCMSYAAVLVAAFTSFGKYARHWAVNGFRDAGHEVVEVWSDSLQKWIHLDPSLSQYYTDPANNIPMSILEQHNVYVNFVVREGETMADLHKYPISDNSNDPLRKRMKELGGGKKAPILCIDSGWHYGKKVNIEEYDWGWYHGYTASGYMRVTTRTNFASQKEPLFPHFGSYVGLHNVFMHWVDKKTPPKNETITLFTERARDIWFTLNQATFKTVRTGEKELVVMLGNTQPFFKHYKIEINGVVTTTSENSIKWVLDGTTNSLKVWPVDVTGQQGTASSLTILYKE